MTLDWYYELIEGFGNPLRVWKSIAGMETRKPYPSDVSDAEWEFVAPYLTLLPVDAEQRRHDLREVFNALPTLVRSGAH